VEIRGSKKVSASQPASTGRARSASNETLDPRTSLARNGRSFFWASRLLGPEMAARAAGLYAFCRVLDDMADGDIAGGPDRLASIKTRLQQGSGPADPALAGFLPLMAETGIPATPLLHLIDGLLQDQQEVALKEEAELLRYCYRVAGTVGLMICPVLDCRDQAAWPFAIDLGIAMQMTNIARDVLEDAQLGRRYLPASWTGPLSAAAICRAAGQPDSSEAGQIRQALGRLLRLAECYYRSAEAGMGALPWRARAAIIVAGRVYRQIGVELQAGGLNWQAGRVVTSNFSKSRASLAGLLALSAVPRHLPTHDKALHDALEGLV
jgi:phytoene synthase